MQWASIVFSFWFSVFRNSDNSFVKFSTMLSDVFKLLYETPGNMFSVCFLNIFVSMYDGSKHTKTRWSYKRYEVSCLCWWMNGRCRITSWVSGLTLSVWVCAPGCLLSKYDRKCVMCTFAWKIRPVWMLYDLLWVVFQNNQVFFLWMLDTFYVFWTNVILSLNQMLCYADCSCVISRCMVLLWP